MIDHSPEPIFARPLVLAESDPTDASTWSSPPKRKSVPKRIASLIGKLGLRFEPSVKADLDAHAARVALLAEDLADADPDKLSRAIDQWVAMRPFLPKASELRGIIADLDERRSRSAPVDVVTSANESLAARGSSLRWFWNDPKHPEAGTYLADTTPLENRFDDLP